MRTDEGVGANLPQPIWSPNQPLGSSYVTQTTKEDGDLHFLKAFRTPLLVF